MKGRVTFVPPSGILRAVDWQKLVTDPATQGYYGEAFANADGLIDAAIENCLRSIYQSHECQDLINEIHYQRARANFEGLLILEILKSKTLIDEALIDKVRHFKKARNLVLHDEMGEYALIVLNPHITYATQQEFDNAAENEALRWLSEARNIYTVVLEKWIEAHQNNANYFSVAFYEANPRHKMIARKFPPPPKPNAPKTRPNKSG